MTGDKFILELKKYVTNKIEESQDNANNSCSDIAYNHFISQKDAYRYIKGLIDQYLKEEI